MSSEADDDVFDDEGGFDPDAFDGEFDDLPETDIETEYHVHFGMAGSFPLRVADLFFASDGLHIVEYSYITPMFGLGTKKHRTEAGAMQSIYDVHGIDEVLLQGDAAYWLNYDAIGRIVLHRGGYLGRPKLTVYPADETVRSHAVRLHDQDTDELTASIRKVAAEHDVDLDVRSGWGLSPTENIRRFFR